MSKKPYKEPIFLFTSCSLRHAAWAGWYSALGNKENSERFVHYAYAEWGKEIAAGRRFFGRIEERIKLNFMKVIAICGSPRKNGNTEIMLKEALKGTQNKGAKTELIKLSGKNIKYCLGHDGCGYPCKIKDDMARIYKKMIEADIIIIGSPVYYCNVSGLLKNFMDRCRCLTKGLKLKGKIGG